LGLRPRSGKRGFTRRIWKRTSRGPGPARPGRHPHDHADALLPLRRQDGSHLSTGRGVQPTPAPSDLFRVARPEPLRGLHTERARAASRHGVPERTEPVRTEPPMRRGFARWRLHLHRHCRRPSRFLPLGETVIEPPPPKSAVSFRAPSPSAAGNSLGRRLK
jgi:hypothetical protein